MVTNIMVLDCSLYDEWYMVPRIDFKTIMAMIPAYITDSFRNFSAQKDPVSSQLSGFRVSCRPMINKPLHFKSLKIRIPIRIFIKGRGVIY